MCGVCQINKCLPLPVLIVTVPSPISRAVTITDSCPTSNNSRKKNNDDDDGSLIYLGLTYIVAFNIFS